MSLLIETSNAYARELLHGIQSYARENRHWALHLTEQGRGEKPPAGLRSWRGDGMIARVETKSVAEAVRPAAVLVVNASRRRVKSRHLTTATTINVKSLPHVPFGHR